VVYGASDRFHEALQKGGLRAAAAHQREIEPCRDATSSALEMKMTLLS